MNLWKELYLVFRDVLQQTTLRKQEKRWDEIRIKLLFYIEEMDIRIKKGRGPISYNERDETINFWA